METEKIQWIGDPWNYDACPGALGETYKSLEYKGWMDLHGVSADYSVDKPYCTTSMICNQEFMDMPFAKYWAAFFGKYDSFPAYHRKQWEDIYICQALYERGYLSEGKHGIGFGVGEECLPDLFASFGCNIVASDLAADFAEAKGWIESGQNAAGDIEKLRKRHFCDDREFYERVSYRNVDMNNIPHDLGGFDFCWSTCALEHLGSLRHGADFIINSMNVLRSGGIAIHTTEYNLYSNDDTMETESCSLYRKKDILEIVERLETLGFIVEPFDWYIGNTIYDNFVDLPPYQRKKLHLRLLIEKYPCTSIGIIVKKP